MSTLRNSHIFTTMWTKNVQFSAKGNKLARNICTATPLMDKQEVKVTFISKDGKMYEAKGNVGDTLLDIAVNNQIHLTDQQKIEENCGGDACCEACHVILTKRDYKKLYYTNSVECRADEDFTIELFYDPQLVCSTSRLGCRVKMTKELDNLQVRILATNNSYMYRLLSKILYQFRKKIDSIFGGEQETKKEPSF